MFAQYASTTLWVRSRLYDADHSEINPRTDVAATHLVGGFVGNLLVGIFGDNRIASLDGEQIKCVPLSRSLISR